MKTSLSSRRQFIRRGIFYGVSLTGLMACHSDTDKKYPATSIKLINVRDLTESLHEFPLYRVAILRDEQGLFALKTVCTHQVCALSLEGGHWVCPCHGSLFSIKGDVVRGPATEHLPHFHIEADSSGDIFINFQKIVTSQYRMILPSKT